jgi:WD40 repeat protein
MRIRTLVTAVAFSPDGTEIVAWDPIGFSRWNVETGRRGGSDPVFAKACEGMPALPTSEDGRTIGVNCRGRLHFFEVRTVRSLGSWQIPKDQGVALYTASPDGRAAAVVMAGALDAVDIRSLGGGGQDTSIEVDNEVERLSIAPGAVRLGVGTFRGVGVRQLPDGKLLRTIEGRSAHAFSNDGTRIAVETGNGASIIDLERDAPAREVNGRVSQLRFGGGGQLLTGWNNQSVFVWDVSSGARRMTVSGEEFVGAALSDDGTRLVTVSLERRGGGAEAVLEIWRLPR